jgi:hypothetical protein
MVEQKTPIDIEVLADGRMNAGNASTYTGLSRQLWPTIGRAVTDPNLSNAAEFSTTRMIWMNGCGQVV